MHALYLMTGSFDGVTKVKVIIEIETK